MEKEGRREKPSWKVGINKEVKKGRSEVRGVKGRREKKEGEEI